jgi:uncharacterized membrane protein YukC
MKAKEIMDEIKKLPLKETFAFHDMYDTKYHRGYIGDPTVVVTFSAGKYTVYWMMPGKGLCEEGSKVAESFPNRDHNLFQKINQLVEKNQEYLLGEEGIKAFEETIEDRKLVQILHHGGKMDMQTGIIHDPITGK